MVRLNIMALRCPDCGLAFEGLENDVVFYCTNCKMAYETRDGKFIPRDIFSAKPPAEKNGQLFWMPVWLFDVAVKVDARPDELVKVKRVVDEFPRVYVSGFRMWRPSYFGNPGFLYTSGALSVGIDENMKPKNLVGCSRSIKEAAEFVKPFLLSIIDRRIDVAFIDISGEIRNANLLAVPYELEGDKVRDTLIKWEYPSIMFEDLPYIVNKR